MEEEIKKAVSQRLRVKVLADVRGDTAYGWTQVKAAVQDATEDDKAQIINLMLKTPLFQARLKALADAEADAMLADGSLNLTELSKVLN